MTTVPYQRMHEEELADLEAKYGRELDEREQIFYGSTGPQSCNGKEQLTTDLSRAEDADWPSATGPSKVTANQIVAAERFSWRLPLLILLTLIIGEAWLAAHCINVLEGFFR